jgi:hypothetical protein
VRRLLGVLALAAAAGLGAQAVRTGAFAGLQAPVGAQGLGLGNALSAVADDPQALWWNPAGLSRMDEHSDQVFLSGELLTQDRYDNCLAYAHRFDGEGTLGLGFRQQGVGAIDSYDSAGDSLGTLHTQDLTLLLAWATEVSYGFRYGLTAKGYHRDLSDQQAWGGGFDLGFYFTPYVGSYAALSLVLTDLAGRLDWSQGKVEQPDTLLTVGMTDRWFEGQVMLAVDGGVALAPDTTVLSHLGLEWRPLAAFAVRAGLDQLSPCAGLNWTVTPYLFDYAFEWDPDGLGNRQAGSVTLKF